MKTIFIICLVVNLLFSFDAKMEIVKTKSILPTINVLLSKKTDNKELSNKLIKLINQDLKVSGHFNVYEFNNDNITSNDRLIMKENGIDLSLTLELTQNNDSSILLSISLFDLNINKLVINTNLTTSNKNRYPFLSHRTAILINDHLKAPSIKWMDRFVIFSRILDSKESEIVISDYTLTYEKVIIKGGFNLFPKWSDKIQRSFYYTTYNKNVPTLLKYDLFTKKIKKIIKSDGMLVLSDISKDYKKLLLTMSPKGQPDIYLFNLETKYKTQLTNYDGIDVGANFIEDDKKIVFVSDRLKYPNIFVKELKKSGAQKFIYHGKNNSSLTSYKDYIVYKSRDIKNEFGYSSFNLYLVSSKSDFMMRLTTFGVNEFPKFSIDGESILFIKTYNNKSSIGIIRINYNKSFLFPLKVGRIQSIDW